MLTEKIRYFHQTSRDTYGSPRICEDLVRAGEHIGKNTVALLMQRAGIVPKTVRKFRVTTDSRKTVPAPNRLEREFVAKHPNQRWVSDITFIPTRQGWLYLAVIIDLYSRAVIGWAMHKRMKTELVTDALKMALMRRKVRRSLLLHSDQGSQYAAANYRAIVAKNGIECSMSRKGNCWDNAVAESFFHTLRPNWCTMRTTAVALRRRPVSSSTLRYFIIVSVATPTLGRWHLWHSRKRLLAAS